MVEDLIETVEMASHRYRDQGASHSLKPDSMQPTSVDQGSWSNVKLNGNSMEKLQMNGDQLIEWGKNLIGSIMEKLPVKNARECIPPSKVIQTLILQPEQIWETKFDQELCSCLTNITQNCL